MSVHRRSCSRRRRRSAARSSSSSASRSTSSRRDYDEHDPPEADAEQLVREHALGKARSVADEAGDRPVLGVDTTVVLGGRIYAKPKDAGDAERMLEELGGTNARGRLGARARHARVGGRVDAVATRVTFRTLTPRDLATYVASRRVGGARGRLRDPGPRRRARRARRRRLPERRRPARVAPRAPARGAFAGVYGFG